MKNDSQEQAGRPLLYPNEGPTAVRRITITDSQWEFLKQVGGGNASEGVRELIRRARRNKSVT